MTNILLKRQAKPLFQVVPERSHPRLSLRRVLYAKALRWVDKSQTSTLTRAISRFFGAVVIFGMATAPISLLGFLASHIANKWVFGLCAVLIFLYHKTILRQVRRAIERKTSNQHCFHGVPVTELADYLLQAQAFPVEGAMRSLRITQPAHGKIAKILEHRGVLTRGESNARILRPISRADLVRQITENFPLEWSEHEEEWVARRDSFATYVLDRERKEKREEAHVEKREKKLEQIEERIEELQNPFTLRELAYPSQGI